MVGTYTVISSTSGDGDDNEFQGPIESGHPNQNDFNIRRVSTTAPFFPFPTIWEWKLLNGLDEQLFSLSGPGDAEPNPNDGSWIYLLGFGSASGTFLPVEFQYFRATPHGTEVKLEWATATESNNKGFEVQHSTDARMWAVLGFEEGFGTTAAEQRYAYWHAAPPHGTHYYRLRQIDYDGAFDYSDIVQVRLKGAAPLQFYPNPAHDHVNIVLPDGTDGQPVHITCTDLLGRTVWQDQPQAAATTHTAYLPTDMPSGVYVIRLRIGQEVWQALLHKQ